MAHSLAHYALNMVVGHNFLKPPPFASLAYQGDLQKLSDAKKNQIQTSEGSNNVIDLEATTSVAQAREVVTTQIIFGSIPTTFSQCIEEEW